MAMISNDDRCPCLSGEQYGQCCGRFHGGADAPTAEQLMRSRYAAFAVGDADYLLRTWHPSTRPATLEVDPELVWRRLDVLHSSGGGLLDDAGTVEFVAYYADHGDRGAMREHSRFVREHGRWFYVDAMP
ncbi:YchJ family protein [Prescottella agglutinans]|uniref:YchJ family protein n=1 Tax=Prescottella agglutinans TaxID=1644129 RepID=UPI003D992BF7